MRRAFLAALIAVLALVVAGCGGDDDGETTTGGNGGGETLTKAEFIKQGDEICERVEDRSEGEAEDFAKENGFDLSDPKPEQIEEAITEVLVPSLTEQADELRALGIPEGDEEQVEEILTALEDGVAEIEDDPASAFQDSPLDQASKLASDYGFEECGGS